VDEQQPKRAGGADAAELKAEWRAVQVERLVAGGAETNAGNDIEGLDGLS
jgi:hypothetical protein